MFSEKKKTPDRSLHWSGELLQLHRENQKRHRQERIELKEMLSSAKDDYDEIEHFSCRWRKPLRNFPVTCKHK